MSRDLIIIIAASVLIVLLSGFLVWWRKFRKIKLDTTFYQKSWKDLQRLCRSKNTWPEAIIAADRLLAHALSKKRYRGRTMGAQLVKAQRLFSDNDAVWYSHKLRSKLESETNTKLSQGDVKQALMGTRQALKDLGALDK
ncbi:MAG TPA: hypothetical protein VLF91_05930 [Candidatus Saccharimonadales bacterium]|nr:hypothetical protein [Candidatus Saccharimonadales bacterium]